MLKITYKDQEYSWEEWEREISNFNSSLDLPDELIIDQLLIDGMMTYDLGYSVAMSTLRESYYVLASARFNLINSYNKFYESNMISHGNSYLSHIWMRSEYMKNSIVLYNSLEDYVYQVIWFAFDMYGKGIKSKKSFDSALKSCNYKNLKGSLISVSTAESNELLDLINGYRFDENIKYLRDNLANNLKHRAHLQFKELNRTRVFGYEKRNNNGDIEFSSSWITPEIIELDTTIEKLSYVHGRIIKFIKDIENYINIFDSFIKDHGSPRFLKQIKPLKKKIIIGR